MNEAEQLKADVQALTGLQTVGHLLQHLGTELALRCIRIDPRLQTKEYAKRELISPLLYIAAILAGTACHIAFHIAISYRLRLLLAAIVPSRIC